MSNEVKTFLVNDERLKVENDIEMAVKNGPQSSITQYYQQTSNSSSSVMFNINVPSENTLVSQKIQFDAVLNMYFEVTADIAVATNLAFAPSAFPLNTCINSASMTINNCSVSVSTQDVGERIKKLLNPGFLAKEQAMTAYLPDLYYGATQELTNQQATSSSSYAGVKEGNKYGVVPRSASRMEVYKVVGGVTTPLNQGTSGAAIIPASVAGATSYIYVKMYVRESILGMPGLSLSEDGSFVGVNNIEFNINLNDCKRIFTSSSALFGGASWVPGVPETNNNLFSNDSAAVLKYYSLPASEYSKMNVKCVTPYNEFVSYKTVGSAAVGNTSFPATATSNNIQLRQIPDKLMICIEPTPSSRIYQYSNALTFPISKIQITLNNRSNLLAELKEEDLFEMSRRNGSLQSYSEYRGTNREVHGNLNTSLGPVVIIDPVRDLQLDSYLSSGSIGAFNLQVTVIYRNIERSTAAAIANIVPQLNIIASYGGVLVTQQGSTVSTSGLLTKMTVLETKDKGSASADVDADEAMAMSGGIVSKGLSQLGQVLRKKGKDKAKSMASKAVSKGADMLQSKISGAGNPSSYNYSGGSYYS